jgi:hypothetical protein
MKEFKTGDKIVIKGVVRKIINDLEIEIPENGYILSFNKDGVHILSDGNQILFHDQKEITDKIVQAAKELLEADWSNYIKKAARLKEALDDYL